MYQVNINARYIHLNILFKTFRILLAFCYTFKQLLINLLLIWIRSKIISFVIRKILISCKTSRK